MDHTAQVLQTAHELYVRANATAAATASTENTRPPVYKAIGISLAIASGCFIGVSFVLKKMGLLKANEKYDEVAGEGYGYLKNAFWWTGMTLMIIGEICNFVAYAFVDAILVTPLGALSVVITTILSAVFLKERLSMVGKVGCFLCIIGSVVIVMNAPAESSAATIQEMKGFIIAPGFLSYAGLVIIGCICVILFVAPKYGKKSMLVYLTVCSLIGGLSVVATQGLGAAVVAQIHGAPYPSQVKEWFLYVLFVFVIGTLVTEIIFLNKALNLFNAALVTPTYYVYFTSSTIITSAILFRGFKGSPTSILTVVMGFFVICAGVVLLQLSKSAKDVPDTAVFAGDLDQVRTIAEQAQPESEPKADAIRGAAAIVRRFSVTRQKMEADEAKRLHEEKLRDLEPIGENEHIEWDGLRRRRTTIGGHSMRNTLMTPNQPLSAHPPLGMSRFPTEAELQEEENRPNTALSSSFFGSIRSRARSVVIPSGHGHDPSIQSPMHPVPLTEIAIPSSKGDTVESSYLNNPTSDHRNFGVLGALGSHKTEYEGGHFDPNHRIQFAESSMGERSGFRDSVGPVPPPHSARRQFSFHNVFRKSQSTPLSEEPLPEVPKSRTGLGSRQSSSTTDNKRATEEERLGLVKGDTNLSSPYGDEEEEEDVTHYGYEDSKKPQLPPAGRVVAGVSPPRGSPPRRRSDKDDENYDYEQQRRFGRRGPPPPFDDGRGGGGAFI